MTEAFEKWMNDTFPNMEFDPYCRTGAKMAAQAILTTPGLLWEQGKPWMSDVEVQRIVDNEFMNDGPESGIVIRDRAQVMADAKDAKLYRLKSLMSERAETFKQEQERLDRELAENTRLRGELEESRRTVGVYDASRQSAWKILEDEQAQVKSLRSELDKAKERVRELEQQTESRIKYMKDLESLFYGLQKVITNKPIVQDLTKDNAVGKPYKHDNQ